MCVPVTQVENPLQHASLCEGHFGAATDLDRYMVVRALASQITQMTGPTEQTVASNNIQLRFPFATGDIGETWLPPLVTHV